MPKCLPMVKKLSTKEVQRTVTMKKERNGKVILQDDEERVLFSLAKQSLREKVHTLNKHAAK